MTVQSEIKSVSSFYDREMAEKAADHLRKSSLRGCYKIEVEHRPDSGWGGHFHVVAMAYGIVEERARHCISDWSAGYQAASGICPQRLGEPPKPAKSSFKSKKTNKKTPRSSNQL